jgi:hypothetical protein
MLDRVLLGYHISVYGTFETLAQRRNLNGAARLRRPLIPEFVCIVGLRSGLLRARSSRSTVQNSTNMNGRFEEYRCDILRVANYRFNPDVAIDEIALLTILQRSAFLVKTIGRIICYEIS